MIYLNVIRFSASQFDGSLANWSLKNATTVQAMFYESRNFTGKGLSTWTDTDKITDFSYMFFGAWNMAADLSSWNTSSATSMRSMFNEATSFTGGLTSWAVDKVIDFTEMYVYVAARGVVNCLCLSNTISLILSLKVWRSDELCRWSRTVFMERHIRLVHVIDVWSQCVVAKLVQLGWIGAIRCRCHKHFWRHQLSRHEWSYGACPELVLQLFWIVE